MEIIGAQLFGVEVQGGCIAVTQAIALCNPLKVDLGPQALVKQEPEEKQKYTLAIVRMQKQASKSRHA